MAYCTNRDLKDIYPSLDEFDTKTPLYGWVVHSSNLYRADNSGLVTQLFANGQDLGSAQANSGEVNSNGEWFYESSLDATYYYNSATNPNDMLMESGDDWATLKTRYISNAEKYLDSRLDGRLPRKQFKDKDGNYDYILVRTTALLACSFLIRASQPTSEIADSLFEEAEKNILSLNEGSTKLSWQVTGDSSQGVIREVSVSGSLRLVDTRGQYHDIYDRIGVKITTAGALGTAKYSVWLKDGDNLGAERMNNGESADYIDTINGQYQTLASGVTIRFAGDTADTATINDKWELEFFGKNESALDSGMPYSIRMSRR
jgi:hypothetical protein|tara:strand:- start:67 stop:1017 length:951 start_codon:yes stop_codon:yes gene_type:complete